MNRTIKTAWLLSFVIIIFSHTSFANEAQDSAAANNLPLEDIQRFTTVINQIKNYYVEPIDDSKLFEDAIRGMLTGLDPHSSYLSIEDFAALQANTSGEFGGLGIEVGTDSGYIKIISPIDDTPAHRAGLQSGDYIIRIDDDTVNGLDLREAVKRMRGKKGTEIELTIFRKSEKKPRKVTLVREVIHVKSVKAHLLEPNYGYVRISNFQMPSGMDLKAAINQLNTHSQTPLHGLVLDLRNNPGGLLDASIQVSDAFLDAKDLDHNNLIVYTKGRINGSQIEAKATPGDILNGAPIVVLINQGSASASEIVAGALQDHNRAIIMGSKTFGKGSVQTILPLDDKRGVKLTTALYYTPTGRSIQATGIKPDITVKHKVLPKDEESEDSILLREADLNGHISNNQAINVKDKNHIVNANLQTSQADAKTKEMLKTDYQLQEALTLLKGVNVLQARKI